MGEGVCERKPDEGDAPRGAERLFRQQPPFPLATALSFQQPFPFCHPEQGRGICGSISLTVRSDLTTMDFVLR